VIQTILHVARLFPVIRFDAAMTLAKRHFHRLWFPGPGASGAIPSRAEYGMSQAEFDRHMPHEFWREVVDRVAAEVPGTLLLAEAFWLMEGYFVRTLGMHRVYNSAFMVMLRDEDNAKYRSVIKNTLEFDPDIMKRYVNFMSNPDERTAIDQFGKGDKCFGVAVMMATLPGLPMFGHGQIEGFTEKYGMEYQRPRYDETADHWLVERHEREIAPLLHKRWLFAESSNFLLYDFFRDSGTVDENVFAYSNRNGSDRALVVYNNRYGTTQGTIDFSAAYADKAAGQLRQLRLIEGLGLSGDASMILAYRDSLTGLEYLRRAEQIVGGGLKVELHAYQCYVFLDWRELRATPEKPWDGLCDLLNGNGVPNLDDALVNLELRPVHDALERLLDQTTVRLMADLAEHPRMENGVRAPQGQKATLTPAHGRPAFQTDRRVERERREFFDRAWTSCEVFLRAAQKAYLSRVVAQGHADARGDATRPTNPALLAPVFRERLRAAMRIPLMESAFPTPWTAAARRVLPSPSPNVTATAIWGPVLAWCVLELLAEAVDASQPERVALDLFDRLRLREPFARAFAALGFEGEAAWGVAARIKVALLNGAGVGAESEAEAEANMGVEEIEQIEAISEAEEEGLHAIPLEAVGAEEAADVQQAAEPNATVGDERVALSPALWLDPDVRWLTGVHEAGGHAYVVHEPYEELLWWLMMPSLLRIAGEAHVDRAALAEMSKTVAEALETAERAGYRIDGMLGNAETEEAADEDGETAEGEAVEGEVSAEEKREGGAAKGETVVLEESNPAAEIEKEAKDSGSA
jgi:hypothetical protein